MILFGVWLAYQMAVRGLFRQVGLIFLATVAGFWLCYVMTRVQEAGDGVAYAILAMLIFMPAAGGLLIGLLTGAWRRYRDRQAHG